TNDEYDFKYPDTLKLYKYQYVKDWFDSIKEGKVDTSGKVEFTTDIANVETVYALGGVHGAIPNYHEEGILLAMDVASLYPALVIEYGLMSRAVESVDKFKEIRDTRIKLKREKN